MTGEAAGRYRNSSEYLPLLALKEGIGSEKSDLPSSVDNFRLFVPTHAAKFECEVRHDDQTKDQEGAFPP